MCRAYILFKPCLNLSTFLMYLALDFWIFCNKFFIFEAKKFTTLKKSYSYSKLYFKFMRQRYAKYIFFNI